MRDQVVLVRQWFGVEQPGLQIAGVATACKKVNGNLRTFAEGVFFSHLSLSGGYFNIKLF
jgi:hypothetical protein